MTKFSSGKRINKIIKKTKNKAPYEKFRTPSGFRHFSWAMSRHSGLNSLSAQEPNNSDTMMSALSVGTYFLISDDIVGGIDAC